MPVCLLGLPVELLEEIAAHTISECISWHSRPVMVDDLDLRLVHPSLTPIFSVAVIKHSKIVINPRSAASIEHLMSYLLGDTAHSCGPARYLTHLEVRAENFVQRTTTLNERVVELIAACENLHTLELSLDGHFVLFGEWPVMKKVRKLRMSGESLFCQLAELGRIFPALEELELLSPGLGGSPPAFVGAPVADPFPVASAGDIFDGKTATISQSAKSAPPAFPSSLTNVHLADINTPTGQLLLRQLPIQPVHFSFSLIHNWELSDLASLLCSEPFGSRLKEVRMRKSRFMAETRLQGFKAVLEEGLLGRDLDLVWM